VKLPPDDSANNRQAGFEHPEKALAMDQREGLSWNVSDATRPSIAGSGAETAAARVVSKGCSRRASHELIVGRAAETVA